MNMTFDDYKDEVAKLKEELVYLKELNNGLDYCAEQESIKSKQLKSTLDEINLGIDKICTDSDLTHSDGIDVQREILKLKALAKHEGKQ